MNEIQQKQLQSLIKFYKSKNNLIETNDHIKKTEINPKNLRFQTLIHLVLSARAKDSVTELVVKELNKLDGGLTPQTLINTDYSIILSTISKLPGCRKKATYLKKIAETCVSDYDGDIPNTKEKLMELPGVGIKTAIITMDTCWNSSQGIGVDTHAHRVSNRIGFVKTKKPEETEAKLEEVIPKEFWSDIGSAMYLLGQEFCISRKPKCSECPIEDCPHKK